MKQFTISVRSLVEFILRSGDIDSGFAGSINANQRALEGTRLHQKLQKAAGGDYAREVALSDLLDVLNEAGEKTAELLVEGRADGIFTFAGDMIDQEIRDRQKVKEEEKQAPAKKRKRKTEQIELECISETENSVKDQPDVDDDLLTLDRNTLYRTVDEIKSVDLGLQYITTSTYPLHFAQAKCYAWFLAKEEGLSKVLVRISYIHTETEKVKHLFRLYTFDELEEFYEGLTKAYMNWLRWQCEWDAARNANLKEMKFPFDSFRTGQRTMAKYVYKAIDEKKKIFLQAPTGIGKTMSAMFPALKAIGEEKCEKVFYLTAKNVTQEAAERGADILYQQGMRLKTLRVTAKDRICFLEKRDCHPEKCPYAKGHFDRVNLAVLDSLGKYDVFDQNVIEKIAEDFQVCPYELSLDIASWCDLIICDYNYAFDPSASLKRFFMSGKQPYVLLVDEAHNLVDRARGMYTAEIDKQEFLHFKKSIAKENSPVKTLNSLNKLFLEAGKALGEEKWKRTAELPIKEEDWKRVLEKLREKLGEYFELCGKNGVEITEEAWELYFKLLFFLRIWPQTEEGYESYLIREGSHLIWRLYCVDPSGPLKDVYQNIQASVFFSATLTPIDYYKKLLGAEKEEEAVALPSPFDSTKRQTLLAPVPVTYRNREGSIEKISNLIRETVNSRIGHYLVFFPSYAFMHQVAENYRQRFGDSHLMVQDMTMTEQERNDFVAKFRESEEELLGFAVLGGVFSEGIDLKGDALIGTIVVTVGLPQIGLERDLIRLYFDRSMGSGFDYAYMYPGIGRVFQAAGRVIRTETDRGIILLIDSRFDEERYRRLYPEEWFPLTVVREDNVCSVLQDFWSRQQAAGNDED